jgi:OOP family OmpA-OmpF porin
MHKILPSIFLLIFLAAPLQAADRDIKNSKDHELIGRYENSVIVGYRYRDYDAFRLPLSMPRRDRQEIKMDDYLDLEGRLTIITYALKDQTSTLKVQRNFENELQHEGFETLFQCAGKQCGTSDIWDEVLDQTLINNSKQTTIRFLAAKKSQGEQGVYVGVYVMETYGGKVLIGLNVMETKEMETGLVDINATALDRQLSENGKVAIYGIQFDRDKAVLKQASAATLEEIKKLLDMKKDLKLYVVGHTDDTGSLEHNLDLSKRRAEAVRQALVKDYGIGADRLLSFGAGPYAPIGSNRQPEGQAKNRRVELVQRLD